MEKFKQHRTLKSHFSRIRVSEDGLARFARKVSSAVQEYDGEIEITIDSADGEETIMTHDPEFFGSENMPTKIKSVSIEYHEYNSPISCKILFSAGPRGFARLSVKGTDKKVTEIFYDLRKKIKETEAMFQNFQKVIRSFWFHIVLSLAVALIAYLAFDLAIDSLVKFSPGFEKSIPHAIFAGVGWFAVGFSFFFGPDPIVRVLEIQFSPVEFTGQLSDSWTRSRAVYNRVGYSIVLPILIIVITSIFV